MAEESTVFTVKIQGDYTPDSEESPAKLIGDGHLYKGIQYAKVSRLRNVLRKLSETRGMESIIKHYLLIGGICEDTEESYEPYEENLRINYIMPEEDARDVKRAVEESHKSEANNEAAGERREAPIVVDDDHEAGLRLPPIRSMTQGAAVSAPIRTYNRPALQDLPQQN
jgi:hypothetical protein